MLLERSNSIMQATSERRERRKVVADVSTVPTLDTPYTHLAFQALQEIPTGVSRSILVVSAGSARLTASTSLSLALAFQTALAQRIVLADAAGGAGSLSELLECSTYHGLSQCMESEDIEGVLRPTSSPAIRFLPAGGPLTRALPAPAVMELLNLGVADEGTLVISGGSLLSNPAAMALAAQVGWVFVVVQEMTTRLTEIRQLEHVLAASGVRRVGMLLADPY